MTQGRRREILTAAFEVFAKNGYRSGSLSQISEIVGISEAGILHHFKTKANLLIEVLRYHDERATESMGQERLNGLHFVEAWLDLVEYNISVPGMVEMYCIVSAEATAVSHPAHEYFQRRYENVIQFAIDAMLQIQKDGHMRAELDPEDLGRALVALSDGLQVQWLLDRKWDMVDEHKSFFRRILTDSAAAELSDVLSTK
jgi:AcrR family transcriptional regulator